MLYDYLLMLCQHEEHELEKLLEFLNCYHLTITFTANYSPKAINFIDVSVKISNKQAFIDLYIKATDTHQHLHATCCHVDLPNKSIPYIQTPHLSRICSENSPCDKRCNELEV